MDEQIEALNAEYRQVQAERDLIKRRESAFVAEANRITKEHQLCVSVSIQSPQEWGKRDEELRLRQEQLAV